MNKFSHLLAYTLSVCNGRGPCLGQSWELGTPVKVQDPDYLYHHCCLPGSLAESWSGGPERSIQPSYFDTGH